MKVKNHTNFAFTNYTQASTERLGEIVKKVEENGDIEIGVIIQNHGNGEYRVDTWGNCDHTEMELATEKEVRHHRPELIEYQFKDEPKFDWSKTS